MITQVSIFLQNDNGRLAEAVRVISDAGLNMRALFLADTATFGLARIFCDQPEVAVQKLQEAGLRASLTPVVAVRVADEPGALASLLEFCDAKGFSIEYGYCFCTADGSAINVLKINDPSVDAMLEEAGFALVAPEEVYAL
ncbi:MAG: amino acid-binding protein [Eggerthellaceae bacterium]|nr:amino acid-binding protein [Eggerthellaceae bacterium]